MSRLQIGEALRCPASKFITHTVSHICFLILLAAATFRLDQTTHNITPTSRPPTTFRPPPLPPSVADLGVTTAVDSPFAAAATWNISNALNTMSLESTAGDSVRTARASPAVIGGLSASAGSSSSSGSGSAAGIMDWQQPSWPMVSRTGEDLSWSDQVEIRLKEKFRPANILMTNVQIGLMFWVFG